MEKICGKVNVKLGDHIDTDMISSNQFSKGKGYGPKDWAECCLRVADRDFPEKMAAGGGGILVVGVNFGCGSSRESAPTSIQMCGAKAIIGEEFARIFYRSAINLGLVCIEAPGITASADVGDQLEVDPATGIIYNRTKDLTIQGSPIPANLVQQFEAGGLMPYLQDKLGIRKKED